ncbi:MAG TPA: translocation/assembly module TamB domain-containing protein [Terriglobales bacterium]|nr:translocation/assembly module TamB domain-containing protein [Terriglobales bacterium]
MSGGPNFGSNPRSRRPGAPRNRLLLPATIGILILLAFLVAGWYFTSPGFQEKVRARVVAELQRSTGGRVELGAFRWDLSRLQFEARNLTVHGREAPGQLPFFHAERVLVRLRIVSIFGNRVALSYMRVDRPVIHLIAYPDGTTNQPQPSVSPPTAKEDVEHLFRFAVQRLDLRQGEIQINDQSLPLDLTADDVEASMDYRFNPARYEGRVHVGKLDTHLQDMRPFASTADAQFTLWPTSAQVTSLTLTSGKSHFQASGHLDNFAHPAITAAYQGAVDVAQLGAVLRHHELRAGTLSLQGRGTYEMGDYRSAGRIDVAGLELDALSGKVHHASLESKFSLDNDHLALSGISGHALGGKLSGDLQVVRWVEPTLRAPHHKLPLARGEQRGVAHFRLDAISLAQLAQILSTHSVPVDRLHLAGSASGTVQATWRGSPRDADAQLALALFPPARTERGQLPLSGRVQAAYSGSRHLLTFSQLNAATSASSLTASGTLGSASANLRLNLLTRNLEELRPILTAFQGPRPIPIILHGKVGFSGTLAGRISSPTLSGRLELTDFDTLLRPSPQARAPRQMHWDLLTADLQLSASSLVTNRGVLRRGPAQLNFDTSVGLQRYHVTPASPVSAQFRLQEGELADVVALAGYSYPLTGRVNATVRADGTWQVPRGQGSLRINRPAFGPHTFDSLTADLRFTGPQAQLEKIDLVQGPATITGAAAYDFRTTALHFDLQGGNFDLARLPALQGGRLSVAGKLDFIAQGSGTLHAPLIDGTLHLRKLVLDGETEGNFTLTASTRDSTTHLVGRSQFAHANLDLDGDVHPSGDFPAQMTLRFSRLDIDPVLQAYLKGRVTGHSSSAGTITFNGPLLRARDLEVRGNVAEFRANIENLTIQNSGPIEFTLAQRTLSLQRLHLIGDGTDFEATGTARIDSPRTLNLRANGTVNLKIVQTLNPDYLSSGIMTVALRFGGTMAAPDVRGRVQISNGSLAYIDLPSGLSNINGTLVFNQDRLRVQTLTAQTGGGLLTLGGFITYTRNLNFDLTAQGKEIRLRYPPGMSTTANVNLHLVGSPSRSTLSGDILVTRFQLARNFDFASYLARARTQATLPNPQSPLNNLRLDVHVTTTPELDVQTAIARVSGDADLRLRGTAAKPVVLGRVDIARGDVNFSGTKYHLERGDITFSNPVRVEPVLDLEASARVRDYDITLGFHGQLDKLNATYSSEPPLPTADIIALLAMGRTREESALLQQSDTSYTRSASTAILNEALNSAGNNRLEKIFGVSRVKIGPEAGGAESNPSWTRVTIEQQISNTLTLTYITNVSQAQQQIIQAEYYLTRNISLIALRDQNGVVSFDISIRHRKK